MGKSCCESKSSELDILRIKQGKVLKIVLVLNAVMFLVEFSFGLVSKSAGLMADSLDMFGDAAVYALSLYALHRGSVWRARAGVVKGILMALFGFFVLAQVIYRSVLGTIPIADTMSFIGGMALFVNLICLYMLFAHRSDDVNMRSTWLCSRNDIIANVALIGSAGLVTLTNSGVPDRVIGFALACLFLKSAYDVMSEALLEIKSAKRVIGS